MTAQKGFTLIELLVVISIIAILSVVGLVVFQNAQKSAKDAKIKADLNAIKKAYETNYDPTLNGGQGGYRKLRITDFAGNQIPGPYTYAYGPDAASPKDDGYQVSATTSDKKTIYASSTQGTLASQGTLGTCDPEGGLSKGLVGYWKLEGTGAISTGQTLAAQVGPNLTAGVVSGAPMGLSYTTGILGSGVNFNGNRNYLSAPPTSSLNFASGSFTVSAWVKLNSTSNRNTILDNYNQWWLYAASNSYHVLVADPFLGADGGTINTTKFQMVTAVRDTTAAKLNLYVDGQLVSSPSLSGSTTLASRNDPWIGLRKSYQTTDTPANGTIDDARMYNRALTPTEISLMYSSGQGCAP